MITDLDIWRSARVLVDEHGDDALIEAALRADKWLEVGDKEGGIRLRPPYLLRYR